MSNKQSQSSIDKDFVPYKEALEIKELGFDEPCFVYYKASNENKPAYPNHGVTQNSLCMDGITAPTYSQAFRWFREKYGICGYVSPLEDGRAFYYMIYTNINIPYSNRICSLSEKWKTYPEAELACLRKLIEIKNNEQI